MSIVPQVARWVLPWPPSTNNLYATVGNRRVLSRAGKAWKEEAIALMRDYPRQLIPEGQLSLTVWLRPPSFRGGRIDVDNRTKIVADAIAQAYGWDDSRFTEHHAYRLGPCVGGAIEAVVGSATRA